jgi:hypothetical protein
VRVRSNVDLNLDTLKHEMLDYLEAGGFALFRSIPGALDALPLVLWDSEHHPDYRMFLEAARNVGVKLILFASREFEASDLDDLLEQVEACNLDREEQRDYESRLREMRTYEGVTCSLEMAFDHNSRMYVYEVQPDWYEEFLSIEDEIASRLVDEDEEDDDSLGGYFSKN